MIVIMITNIVMFTFFMRESEREADTKLALYHYYHPSFGEFTRAVICLCKNVTPVFPYLNTARMARQTKARRRNCLNLENDGGGQCNFAANLGCDHILYHHLVFTFYQHSYHHHCLLIYYF